MDKWTDDAREYLSGYLRQVAALAKRNGDDAEEIVSGLRDHIEEKAVAGGVGQVDLDLLMEVLAEVGSPEDIIESDGEVQQPKVNRSVPPLPKKAAPPIVVVQKSHTGRWIFAIVMVLLFIVSIPVLMIIAAILFPAMERAEEAALRAACAHNLKQVSDALHRYSDTNGSFPSLATDPGILMFRSSALFSDYLNSAEYLVCPKVEEYHSVFDPILQAVQMADQVSDQFYVYPQLVTKSLEDWEEYVAMYLAIVESERTGEKEPEVRLPQLSSAGQADADRIPVLVERPGHHVPEGGNVLFLDGSVRFMKMG